MYIFYFSKKFMGNFVAFVLENGIYCKVGAINLVNVIQWKSNKKPTQYTRL